MESSNNTNQLYKFPDNNFSDMILRIFSEFKRMMAQLAITVHECLIAKIRKL